MLRWPDREQVLEDVRAWAAREAKREPELVRLGLFGSYARGDAGVGSDVDLVAVVASSASPFHARSRPFRTERLLLPADLLVYTEDELRRLPSTAPRFARMLASETIWLYGDGPREDPG